MGSFGVLLEVGSSNAQRFEQMEALVDTGATYTWLPHDVLDRLGVRADAEWPFVLANGREVTFPIGSVRVRINGRDRTTVVVFGDPGTEPLLGVVSLEEFGLAADPVN